MTEPTPAEKLDPETLVLRAKPRRIVRIKRNVLVGVVGAGCLILAGLGWLGLRPSLYQASPDAVSGKDPEKHRASLPDPVAALPKTYAEVPVLGEPLPGDLGGPILEHRRKHGGSGVATSAGAVSNAPSSDAVARTNGLFFPLGAAPSGERSLPPNALASVEENQSLIELTAAVSARRQVTPKDDRFATAAGEGNPNAHSQQRPASTSTVTAGTIISAALITGLNSDLPGTVLAQVTADVHDVTGRTTLIPQGTRLIGVSNSAVSFGQSRALIVWQRLIWPDGRTLDIDNMPASDLSGYAGLFDRVSFHNTSLLKGIGLSTLLGLAGELGNDSDDDLVKALRQSVQQTANLAGQKIVDRQLDVQPTLTVRPGWPLRVIVQKNLLIPAYEGAASNDQY